MSPRGPPDEIHGVIIANIMGLYGNIGISTGSKDFETEEQTRKILPRL